MTGQASQTESRTTTSAACCDSTTLQTCCGAEAKAGCCGPRPAPRVCGCGGKARAATSAGA